jgi:hypothetical protein
MAPLPTRDYREIIDDPPSIGRLLDEVGFAPRARSVARSSNIREIEKARSEGKF